MKNKYLIGLQNKIIASLRQNTKITKKERIHVKLLFKVAGDASFDDLCELADDPGISDK